MYIKGKVKVEFIEDRIKAEVLPENISTKVSTEVSNSGLGYKILDIAFHLVNRPLCNLNLHSL